MQVRESFGSFALAALLWVPTPAHAVTISVGSCPGAIFTRIQSAVDAAVPGTTIVVCPGVHPEQIIVTKRIRLLGAPGARLVPPALRASTTSPRSARPVAAALTLLAPATIDGLAIDVAAHGITTCDGTEPLLAGIYVRGVKATVTGTAVTGARIDGATASCANGVAILAEGGAPRLRLEGNSLDEYQRAGIVVQDPGTRAVVRENFVQGDATATTRAQTGIEVSNGAAARVEENVVRSHAGVSTACELGTGIALAAARSRARGNQLEGNAVGIRAESRGHTIRDNAIDGAGAGVVGLDLLADESRVTANTIVNESVAAIRVVGNRSRLKLNGVSGVHEAPGCVALREEPACDPLLVRCGVAVWLLGRANQVMATGISDADVAVVDDGRGNVVR